MRIVENFLRCNKFLLHADIGLTIRSEPLTRYNELTILVDGFMDTITIYYFFPKCMGVEETMLQNVAICIFGPSMSTWGC